MILHLITCLGLSCMAYAHNTISVFVPTGNLTRIHIEDRMITRIAGIPNTVTSHLDKSSGSLFIETHHGFTMCLFDEHNTPYDVLIIPKINSPSTIALDPQTPTISYKDTRLFLTHPHRHLFQETITNDTSCPQKVLSFLPKEICIFAHKQMINPGETITLYSIHPLTLKRLIAS